MSEVTGTFCMYLQEPHEPGACHLAERLELQPHCCHPVRQPALSVRHSIIYRNTAE